MTITMWLKQASDELADNMFESPRLDAEIILAHTIGHPRTYLHAHGDEDIDARHEEIANARIELRKDHVPIAYIIGHKEFYGRRFRVTPTVLVPRPESEQLITLLKELFPPAMVLPGVAPKRLVDIGTGCGCLGITAKLELPQLDVALIDTSKHALNVATRNATAYEAEVETYVSDLLQAYPYSPDIIMANLPYVDTSWEQSAELAHEPTEALFATDGGLRLIKRCLDQARRRMKPGGTMLLEADPRQLDAIASYARRAGFHEVARDEFVIAFRNDQTS